MVNELRRLRNEGVDNTLRISSLTLKGAAKLCYELFHAKYWATDSRFLADALIGWRKTVTKYVVIMHYILNKLRQGFWDDMIEGGLIALLIKRWTGIRMNCPHPQLVDPDWNIDDSSEGEYPLERPSLARVCREKDGDKLADPSASRANESREERLQTATTQLTSARPIRTHRWLDVACRVCLLYSCHSSRIAYMTDDVFQGLSLATLPSPSLFVMWNTIRYLNSFANGSTLFRHCYSLPMCRGPGTATLPTSWLKPFQSCF